MKVKQRNYVTSFIVNYIKEMVPKEVNEIHLFSDNCWGQNKNRTLCKVCLALSDTGKSKVVKQFFPLREHSYNP